MATLRTRLTDKDERFGPQRRAALGEATTTGLAWCQRANMALAEAAADPASESMNKVRRWFASSVTTEEDLESVIRELSAGFKKVTATLNSNQLIFTDMPSLRGATGGQYLRLLNSYAFVFGGRYEKLPIVYIENAFFGPHGSPLPDKTLWALTVVHEITHIDASTKDHHCDNDGLRCGPMFDPDDAAENADSWAYFCADCANALTPSQINAAMVGWQSGAMPSPFLDRALAALCLCTAACAVPAQPAQENPMSQDHPATGLTPVSARRPGPPKVPAVRVGELRFEQARLSRKEAQGGQRCGYLAAYKGDTDEVAWRVRVYEVTYDPRLEGDVQDVFFAAMSLSADGRQILVDNEDGARYAVDIDGDHAVHVRR